MYRILNKLTASIVLCLVCLALGSGVAFGQTETARLQGTVIDAAGAVIAGATVKATSVDTNRTVETQTNENGEFSILALQPGRYRIEVTQANFKTTQQDITLEVAQVTNLPIALEAGAVSETVTITNDAPLVESASSAIGATIDGRQAVELPLNGRNVLELARLSPGVTQGVVGGFASGAGNNAETFRGNNTGGAAISVNGQRTQANNFLLDGVDNNESLVNTVNVFPAAEATQEFRVQTSVATAEFGRGGGAIINTAVKSGRNDFYGSAFVFVRNDDLDARPTFNAERTEFRRGQFGGTFGGPLYLPAFGEGGDITIGGKDRLFFFVDYEGLRQFLPFGVERATVPTVAFRNGDFSQLLSVGIQLKDPITGANLPNNIVPAGRINQIGLNYLRAFPLPTTSGVFNNYEAVREQTQNNDTFDIRIDGVINDRNRAFGRYSYGRYNSDTTSRLPTLPAGFGSGSQPQRNYQGVIGVNSSITENIFNELRVQAARQRFGFTPPFFERAVSAELGIPNANRDATLGGGALIGGFNGQIEYTGDFGLYNVPQNTYQLVDSVSLVTGNHTLKFGGTILRREVDLFRPLAGKGFFRLFGNGNEDGVVQTGFEQSDLLLGFVREYFIGPPTGTVGTNNWENALFFQDDWKVNSRLTLNLGLRYEIFTNPAEEFGRQANFNLSNGQLIVAEDGNDPLVENDRNDFSPRAGFAYDIFGGGRSILRGGYGLFYFLDRGGIDNQLAQNPPFGGQGQFRYADGFRIALSGRAPNGSNNSQLATGALPFPNFNTPAFLQNPQNVSVVAIRPDIKTSNVHQFNIQFQQQLTGDTALSVGYVGTRGRNLSLYYNLNGRVIDPAFAVPCPRSGGVLGNCYTNGGNVNVRDDIGESQYDSLQVQLERRFSKGWQYIASYTFSKTKDNGEGAFDSSDRGGANFLEPFGTSRLDFPHVFSFASTYDIPFGRGRQFGSDINPVLNAFIGGWQLNGIFRAQSGSPFDIRINGVRVDLIGDPYTGSRDPYFLNPIVRSGQTNAAPNPAFREAPAGRFGTLERNSLRSPSTYQLNLGLSKNFSIYEDFKVQFRTEAFNIFNTPQLTGPELNTFDNTFVSSEPELNRGNFGRIRGTAPFSNRQIQFGLRLEF